MKIYRVWSLNPPDEFRIKWMDGDVVVDRRHYIGKGLLEVLPLVLERPHDVGIDYVSHDFEIRDGAGQKSLIEIMRERGLSVVLMRRGEEKPAYMPPHVELARQIQTLVDDGEWPDNEMLERYHKELAAYLAQIMPHDSHRSIFFIPPDIEARKNYNAQVASWRKTYEQAAVRKVMLSPSCGLPTLLRLLVAKAYDIEAEVVIDHFQKSWDGSHGR